MLSNDDLYRCRICGYLDSEPPWGEDNASPLFEHCACCGVEHGYPDATVKGCRRYRKLWLEAGAKWTIPKFKPENWDLAEQMSHIPEEYL